MQAHGEKCARRGEILHLVLVATYSCSALGAAAMGRQMKPPPRATLALRLLAHSTLLAGAPSAADADTAGNAASSGNGSASFVSLAGYPLARCLDGSPSGYYSRGR